MFIGRAQELNILNSLYNSNIEDHILAYKVPLYERRTPFYAKALAYGIVGGTPKYLIQIKDTALFSECKWTNEKVDFGVLETLVERSNLFRCKHKHFYLFAKAGFTKGCIDKAAEMGNVTPVEYAEMFKN